MAVGECSDWLHQIAHHKLTLDQTQLTFLMSWLLHRLAHETVKFLAVLPVRGNQTRGNTVRIWEEGYGIKEWKEEGREGWRYSHVHSLPA